MIAYFPPSTYLTVLQELAHKTLNLDFRATASVAERLVGDEAQWAHIEWSGQCMGQFVASPPTAQLSLLEQLLDVIEGSRDANGLEGLLMTAIQSAWSVAPTSMLVRAFSVWADYVKSSEFAANKMILAYDEYTRTIRAFGPGELADLHIEDGFVSDLLKQVDDDSRVHEILDQQVQGPPGRG
ncbi:hypothetical protein ACWEQW_34710, partial [Streptomyces nigra]